MSGQGKAEQDAAPGRTRWWMATLLLGPITFVMSLDRTAIVIAAPTIQSEYHFTLVQMSFLLTAFSWTYALLQVPSGWLAERFGPRRMLYWANLLWSILTGITPLATGFGSFVLIRGLLGAGQSADWPSSVVALKRWFPPKERAKANSILLGALYLGPIAAGPITAAVILHFGWRWAFYGFGILGLLIGFAWWSWFRDNPADHPMMGADEARMIADGQAAERSAPVRGAFVRGLGSVQFWALGVQYFCLVMIQSFYTTWLPTYLMRDRHFSLASMGFFSSLPWVALFVMVFVTGALSDRILRRTGSVWAARVPVAIVGFAVASLALIAASRTPQIWLMMVLLCVSLGAVGLTQVSIWSATQDLGRGATGVVSGWTNFWGNAAGVAGPVLMAYLVHWTGSWAGALLGIALSGAVGIVLWLFVHPERPIAAFQNAAS
ncbi:MAG: MFS transporter [Rhodospirillales bacterium]|nr:MFS transporter [Rhodospirillales bacterium]